MISFRLNETLAKRYGDAESHGMVKKAMAMENITEAVQTEIRKAFSTECAVVFSDISGFSRRTSGKPPNAIRDFLDDYYAQVIPIIYHHGGLVDQMIGDGIISVFCPELSPMVGDAVFDAGLKSAENIVKAFAGNAQYTTKCALHKDVAIVCEVGDDNYRQATIVGEVMTIVHRVEGVAIDESVNMLLAIPEAKKMYNEIEVHTCVNKLIGSSVVPAWTLGTFCARLIGVGNEEHEILYEKYKG